MKVTKYNTKENGFLFNSDKKKLMKKGIFVYEIKYSNIEDKFVLLDDISTMEYLERKSYETLNKECFDTLYYGHLITDTELSVEKYVYTTNDRFEGIKHHFGGIVAEYKEYYEENSDEHFLEIINDGLKGE